MTSKLRIDVSAEMTAFIGTGAVAPTPDLPDPLFFRITLSEDVPTIEAATQLDDADDDAAVVLAVTSAACRRTFGCAPSGPAVWHLPAELALLAVAIRDCPLPEPARSTLRLAKCIELLCAIFTNFGADALIPADGAGRLSERDATRLAAARRLVDERWQEKLTLDGIARACGLNRAKLTRGFRQAFGSTVADAIAERRLQGAHRLLVATDLPVSSIGYRCGYSNNASFTRAFSRRYGVAPTRLRALEVAA
jgi:AraC family transcriptional activator of pyochelin receptor